MSSMNRAALDYIEPAAVADLLSGPNKDKTLVIDVRGQDFLGGHIKGAVNVSSDKFADDDDVADTIAEYLDGKGKDTVIVHCALSQQRGPFCAERLSSRLAALDTPGAPKVKVLAQGFNGFVRVRTQCDAADALYGDRSDLCTDVDKAVHGDR